MEEIADLVRCSRAGDIFHYRWAARRCLRMVNPSSSLKLVTIEGSKDSTRSGEYVIDVAEYYQPQDTASKEFVRYFQLKHSTKRLESPFIISDFKETIEGFSKRYISLLEDDISPEIHSFTILTNRKIREDYKKNIIKAANGELEDKRLLNTLIRYTNLRGDDLKKFCALLAFEDDEGGYLAQRNSLHLELSLLVAGVVDNAQVDTIISLVSEKALPDNDGRIVREEVLQRLGATSSRDLFPAPPKLELLSDLVPRKQHDELLQTIINAQAPVIIHAEGGVGKTVVCQQLADSLPIGSKAIIYDCFGAGKYRRKSEPRHSYRAATVQISNELATFGLCESLVPHNFAQDDVLLRSMIDRIKTSILNLRKMHEGAIVIIFIDAADNAEMAASEFAENCFAHQLLREELPEGCRLVALCRTERVQLLKPQSYVIQKALKPFNLDETTSHIKKVFPEVTDQDSIEFHRLTGGNPRVQANALNMRHHSIPAVLESLGPTVTSVNDQIEAQLKSAIAFLKESIPDFHQEQIESICLGLANLPPFIPIKVLAVASGVNESEIRSFVSDLGRPLWITENSVQFRDEPTETWFREQYSASKQQISNFIERVKPLAVAIPYVSEALPALYIQAEKYRELVELALTDTYLPKDSPIDARNIRIYRLQFAFKAALKLEQYADVSRLAMRAGEEVAGNDRQFEVLKKNIDFISPLQSDQRVQDLAFRKSLSGGWQGSENVYSASLLASVTEFKGEARSYLRSAERWLDLYFKERDKEDSRDQEDRLNDDEIIELSFSHYHLFGEKGFVDSVARWRPAETILKVVPVFISKLIDAGKFLSIDKITRNIEKDDGLRYKYFLLAITHELWKVGKTPPLKSLRLCLNLLLDKEDDIPEFDRTFGDEKDFQKITSFAEACASKGINKRKIRKLLSLYTDKEANYYVRSEHDHLSRYHYLRRIALDAVLSNTPDINILSLFPKKLLDKEKESYESRELREYKELVGGMLPWHIVRAKVIVGFEDDFCDLLDKAGQDSSRATSHRYRDYDSIPYEINRIKFELLLFHSSLPMSFVDELIEKVRAEKSKYWFCDQISTIRALNRLDRYSQIREELEGDICERLEESTDSPPEETADLYIDLSRAVLTESKADAAAYFDLAIEAVSKFGDEMTERWEAVASIAKRYSDGKPGDPELSYRFLRCAELIGEHVAREKYIDRNGAVEICGMISPQQALAGLSRWRERDVGWFESQLPSLIVRLAKLGNISPSVAWSFSAFSGCRGDSSLVNWCLENEPSSKNQQLILNVATRDFLILNSSVSQFHKLVDTADKLGVKSLELNRAIVFHDSIVEDKKDQDYYLSPKRQTSSNKNDVDWGEFFNVVELDSAAAISDVIDRFEELETPRDPEQMWRELLIRVKPGAASEFLSRLVEAESLDRYDVRYVIGSIPASWKRKPSFKKAFPEFVYSIARRFSVEYCNYWAMKDFITHLDDDSLVPYVESGVVDGLCDTSNLLSASTFFGFAKLSTSKISLDEARDVLEYSLSRFDEHTDIAFGDGPWRDDLIPPLEMGKAATGLVWSALGSPRSSTRWEAAHCVRRLAELNCENEIDALITWMNEGVVDAFGYKDYPFYVLHATQYLLMALARVAINDAELLRRHSNTFRNIALESYQHALIQKYAVEIALSIEKQFTSTYPKEVIGSLKKIGVSQLPIKILDRNEGFQGIPWKTAVKIDSGLEFFFAHDFDRYWFESLADIFGVSSEQVQQLSKEYVINEWKVASPDDDPRAPLWRARRHERETWHSHYSYPDTDNYRFYISYHAMLVIAAKLLERMPVVRRYDEDERWEDWIHRHSLSSRDGTWLSDRRDPPPLERRGWFSEDFSKQWRWEISLHDFLDGLLRSENNQTWLNVYGHWNECDEQRNEKYSISSALVDPCMSQSLMNALNTCNDPREYKLPHYLEDRMEYELASFDLKGWVYDPSTDKRVDEKDPHAGDISYPPIFVGKNIEEILGIQSDSERRYWYKKSAPGIKLLKCALWGECAESDRDSYTRRGSRLSGKLSFLIGLCKKLKKDLIIEVQIERSISRSYDRNEDDETRYPPPYSKVYILSENGVLRDSAASYQLRTDAG